MQSYAAARSTFSFLSFLSWCAIILGGVLALGALVAINQMSRSFGGPPMAGLAGLIPGFAMMIAGVMGLVLAQIGRAGVDSAEYAQQSLKIARDQLEISRQALKQGKRIEEGYAAVQAAKEELKAGGSATSQPDAAVGYAGALPSTEGFILDSTSLVERHEYKGREIIYDGESYYFSKLAFGDLVTAQKYIDRLGVNPAAISSDAPRS